MSLLFGFLGARGYKHVLFTSGYTEVTENLKDRVLVCQCELPMR